MTTTGYTLRSIITARKGAERTANTWRDLDAHGPREMAAFKAWSAREMAAKWDAIAAKLGEAEAGIREFDA